MRSAKSFLVLIGAGAIAANAIIGCSTDDSRLGYDDNADDGGSKANLPQNGPAPESTDDNPSPSDDAGKKPALTDAGSDADAGDAGHVTDAGDAGDGGSETLPDATVPPDTDAGAPGSPCPTKDAVQQQSCGLCGVQYRLCAPSDSTAGSPTVWQPWGFCQSEVKDGCVPGTTTTEGCGLCGSRQKVCQNDCRWAAGACKNEPANACAPGTEDYQVGLSCAQGGRVRLCQDSCTYGPYSDCFVPGRPKLTLTSTVGAKVTGQFKLDPTVKAGRLDGDCPNATISSTQASYQYVLLVNPTSSTLGVSVWTGLSTKVGAGYIDTVMASYAGDTEPATAPERQACVKGRSDGCSDSDPTACVSSWAGLVGSNRVTVPPNGNVLIYVGGWNDTYSGDYQLTARTDSAN